MKRSRLVRRKPMNRKGIGVVSRMNNLTDTDRAKEGKRLLGRLDRKYKRALKSIGVEKPKKQPIKWVEKELDALASKLCKAVAGHKCVRCGATEYLQWHHIVTRRIKTLRWDMSNGLCLCRGCHFWWHNVAQMGEQWSWLDEKFGPDLRAYLNSRVKAVGDKKIDRKAIRESLQNTLASVEKARSSLEFRGEF